jgi:hypothetical protein
MAMAFSDLCRNPDRVSIAYPQTTNSRRKGSTRGHWDAFRADGHCSRHSDASVRSGPAARAALNKGPTTMSLRLKICRDIWGTWSVQDLTPISVSHFPSLSAAIEYARKACNAAPATIELLVDGMYLVVHQERGWPRQLVAAETDRPRPAGSNKRLRGLSILSRFLARARRSRPLSATCSAAASTQQTAFRA